MHSRLFTLATAAAALLLPLVNAGGAHLGASFRHRSRTRKLAKRGGDMPTGWNLVAECLTDAAPPNRLLSQATNFEKTLTPAVCAAHCNSNGFAIAGVQDGHECWCGNDLSRNALAGHKTNATECNSPCVGDQAQTCGGYFRLTLYSKKKPACRTTSATNTWSSTSTTPSPTTTTSSGPASTKTPGNGKYKLVENMSGSSFFDHFTFFTAPDPTNGQVNYVSGSTATSEKLAYVENNVAVMKVDNTHWLNAGANRNSVRITSKNGYSTGLMLFDVAQMPYGCSVWPALWTVGAHWPEGGEIDIIEGVNNATVNQLTLHTGASTSCNTQAVPQSAISTSFMNKGCASTPDANAGCGYQDTSPAAFGAGFNAAGGAVYALLIDANSGTTIWQFPVNKGIPADITSGNPDPSSWGTPKASWPSSNGCKTSDVISKQNIVFDITLCGGWAASDYPHSGCPGSCTDMVKDPTNYNHAVWKVNSVKIYQ